MRFPSQGMRFGDPPKLQGHEIVQLQLSATVAESCQDGVCARMGTVRTSRTRVSRTPGTRMPQRVRDHGRRVNGAAIRGSVGTPSISGVGSMARESTPAGTQ